MDEIESVAADTTCEADHQYSSNPDHSDSETESLRPPTRKALRLEPSSYNTYLNAQSDESLFLHRPISDQFERERPHNRPVGIAQPIRIEDSQGTYYGNDSSTTSHSEIHAPNISSSKHMQALASLDQGSDSDHSQKSRYNKFSNERKPISDPPSQSTLSLAEAGQSHLGQYSEEDSEEWPSPLQQSHMHSPHSASQLPPGKEAHVFISHSTSDQRRVEEKLVNILESPPDCLVVRACYQCMPDESHYDDKAIRSLMKNSCAIIICLNPLYLQSDRCKAEWKYAVELFNEGHCHSVIVVAIGGLCSRPEPLKCFLYLDFIDPKKVEHVKKMLFKNIYDATSQALQTRPLEEYTHPTTHTDRMQEEFEADFGEMFPHNDEQNPGFNPHQIQEDAYQLVDQASHNQYEGHVMSHDSYQDQVIPREGEEEEEEEEEGTTESEEMQHTQNQKDVEEGEVSDSSGETEESQTQSKLVATFYDKLAQPDADKRNESPILHLRNFNNWVKTVLIRNSLHEIPYSATVLDLCCGKGGDMPKWKRGGIKHLVCADISESSVEQCQERYSQRKSNDRNLCDAEFIVADCCVVRLRDRYRNPARRFDLTSCQFSVHYSFESYERAHMMLRNACENLLPGGCFIGTTIDASELINRLRSSGRPNDDGLWSIGNDVFSVTLSEGLDPRHRLPLFGAVYNFKLHGVVDLPEFLVHFPLLVEILEEFGMELKLRQNFYDFFTEHRNRDAELLYRMSAFDKRSGTMSVGEWEVIGLYLVFVFQKKNMI